MRILRQIFYAILGTLILLGIEAFDLVCNVVMAILRSLLSLATKIVALWDWRKWRDEYGW